MKSLCSTRVLLGHNNKIRLLKNTDFYWEKKYLHLFINNKVLLSVIFTENTPSTNYE
jgi:hypothetical protein